MLRHADGAIGAALGAARLARLAATGDALAEVCVAPPVVETIAPEPASVDLLAGRLARYRRLYRALRDEFRRAD
jgi:xylulokinase